MEKKKLPEEELKELEEWLKALREGPLNLEPRSMLEPIPPNLFDKIKIKKNKKKDKKE